MTKEELKNILIENKCIASGDWDNENPFVSIDFDTLYDILKKEKQQWIDKACEWLFKNTRFTTNDIRDFKNAMKGE